MEVTNLTGLEKPLQKLVETVSEGVGVVGNHLFKFDVAKIKRIGRAQAEAEKEEIIAKAEGQEQAIEVLSRAGKRFALEQYNKQINLENILVKSKEDLVGKEVSADPVDKDWTMRFLSVAQDIGREEIQNVLARILSGEVQSPGSFSYQTLEVIKNLTKNQLETFLKFLGISTDLGVIKLSRNGKESLEKYGLSFGQYLNLASIGLFNQSSTLTYAVDIEPQKSFAIIIGFQRIHIENQTEVKKKFDLGVYAFSNVGIELRTVLQESANTIHLQSFMQDLTVEIEKKALKVKVGGE